MSLAMTASAFADTQIQPVAAPAPQQHRQIMPLQRRAQHHVQPMSIEQYATQHYADPATRTPFHITPASLRGKAPMHAALAESDVVELIMTDYNYGWVYYDYSGDWYCSVMCTVDNGDQYDLNIDFYSESLYGEFGFETLDPYYTYGRKNNVEFSVVDGHLSVTPGAEEGKADLDATFVTSMGETLHVVVAPLAHEHQDIVVEGKVLNNLAYYDYSGDWNISFQDYDNYRVTLDFSNPADPARFEGTYTLANCWADYTDLYDIQTGLQYRFTELEFTTTGDPNSVFEVVGSGVLDNGDNVTFHYQKSLPVVPTEYVEVDGILASLLFVDPMSSHNTPFVVSSADQKLQFHVAYKSLTGTFDSFDMMHTWLKDSETGETLELDHGQIQVAASTDNVITVDAQLVFENAVSYSFHVQKELEVAGHKTVEAHNMEQTDLFGLIYYLIASNDEYSRIQASMMASPFPGDWTDYIVFVLDADTYEVSSSIVKSAIITEDTNGNLVLDAQFLGDDFVDYTLHMDLYVPDVTDQATFVSHSAELNDLTDYYGAFQITALSDDGNDYLSIVLDDWYIHSASYNALSSANKSYCYVILNLGGEDQKILPMYKCDVIFIVDGNTFSLTGECQAGNTIYDIDLSGVIPEEEPQGDAYDDPDNDVDTEFTLDEISLFEYRADYGYYLIQLANVEGECFYSLIYTDSEELQAGVYPISTEYAPGTVQAGSVSGTSAYPTFYAHLNDAGQITPPLWLCVGGTVTIGYDAAGDISLLVEAVNTWGRTARIMVNGDPTGIHSVEAQQPNANGKRFENRQILIHTNGQDYNAFGQKLQR